MENGGSLVTSLPPNYVTLASLKKRREEEEQRKKEKEKEEEERLRKLKEEEEKERLRKLKKEEEEEVKRLKEDEIRFKKRFVRGRKPSLESGTEQGSEISIKKTDDWRERKKKWKQKKAERKAKSHASGTSTVEVSSVNPTVVVEESKETKPQGSDREVQVVDQGRRRRWRMERGGRKEWRKKEESSTNPVAEIAPSVSGVSESNNEKPARNWGFRSNNWRSLRGRRFENRVNQDGNLMWVKKKEQVTAESTVADSSITKM